MDAAAIQQAAAPAAFIQATEVWTPHPGSGRLTRSGGLYGALAAFDETSAGESFGKGEGLPGRAWAEARPVLMHDLTDPAFRRGAAAAASGLGAALAVPVFCGDALKGVLVMFFAAAEEGVGAVEIWSEDGDALRLEAGFYGAATAFREASEQVAFRRGQGLPGGVWGANAPVLLHGLGRSPGFLRAAEARAAGLDTGLGLPVPTPSGAAHVLTLLSAPATPVARRFEIWRVASGRSGRAASAALIDGFCDTEGAIFDSDRQIQPWQGAVGQAMATGAPVVEAAPAALPGAPRFAGVVALPQHVHGEVARVVAWFL